MGAWGLGRGGGPPGQSARAVGHPSQPPARVSRAGLGDDHRPRCRPRPLRRGLGAGAAHGGRAWAALCRSPRQRATRPGASPASSRRARRSAFPLRHLARRRTATHRLHALPLGNEHPHGRHPRLRRRGRPWPAALRRALALSLRPGINRHRRDVVAVDRRRPKQRLAAAGDALRYG